MSAPTTTRGSVFSLLNHLEVYVPHASDHPVQIALRTYSLALALSLGPRLLPFLTWSSKARSRSLRKLPPILKRELGPTGFAFSITLAIAGGSYLQNLLKGLEEDRGRSCPGPPQGETRTNRASLRMADSLRKFLFSLSGAQKAFILNTLSAAVASVLLNSGRKPSHSAMPNIPMTIPIDDMPRRRGIPPTLDLTLLFFVRAVDSVVHGAIHDIILSRHRRADRKGNGDSAKGEISDAGLSSLEMAKKVKQRWVSHLDALVFSACSARIMWCFFYEPERLPPSYVKWISTLAEIDPRVASVLRSIRNGSFSYLRASAASNELSAFAEDLGYPSSWGNPALLPAYGTKSNEIWKQLQVRGRDGIGGIPCELVHGGNGAGNSCIKNIGIRGSKAWLAAIAIYLPVHFLTIVFTRPRQLLELEKLVPPLLGTLRSATFLSSFVSFVWFGVCSTRTMLLARLFPFISHDYFDGPFGCIYIASLICGSSIWIEHKRKRGEIAQYVLPRAIRACLSDSWLKNGGLGVKIAEQLVFVFSLATLLTGAIHRPDSLRGLSHWTLGYIMNGSSHGFWRQERDRAPKITGDMDKHNQHNL